MLDWITTNDIVNNSNNNDYELMSTNSVIRMIYNILPTNRSFLEMLVIGDNLQKINLIRHCFKICNEEKHEGLGGMQPQIPLIRNLEGKTALDYALSMD